MQIDATKLKSKIIENNMTQESLANGIGIGRTSLYRRLTGKKPFLLTEVGAIASILGLSNDEVVEIFLSA